VALLVDPLDLLRGQGVVVEPDPGDRTLGRLVVGVVDEEAEEAVLDDRLRIGVGVLDVRLAVGIDADPAVGVAGERDLDVLLR
jgi:hypothetical protein